MRLLQLRKKIQKERHCEKDMYMYQDSDENYDAQNRSLSRKKQKRRIKTCSMPKDQFIFNEKSENSITHKKKLSNSNNNINEYLQTLEKQFERANPSKQSKPSQTGYKDDENLPNLQKFKYTSNTKTRNLFEQATYQLGQHFHPEVVSCRDQQKKIIYKFVMQGIAGGGHNQTLYISGVPGIGKTICVDEVLKRIERQLREKRERQIKERIISQRSECQLIYINAMTLKTPKNIFKVLYKKISGFQAYHFSALCYLNDFFQRGSVQMHNGKILKMKTYVIVIDQFDLLSTPGQGVIYNILEWTQQKNASLNLIAISNTIDLPEKLPPKIGSRMGNQRKVFVPYQVQAIKKIMKQRIQNLPIFDDNALEYISKKLVASTTDVRKCLKIVKQSVILYLKQCSRNQEQPKKVSRDHIIKIHSSEYDNLFVKNFKYFHHTYKVILRALAQYYRCNIVGCFYSELYARCRPHLIGFEGSIRPALQDMKDMGFISINYSTFTTDRRVDRTFKLHKNVQELCIKLQSIQFVDSILAALAENGMNQPQEQE